MIKQANAGVAGQMKGPSLCAQELGNIGMALLEPEAAEKPSGRVGFSAVCPLVNVGAVQSEHVLSVRIHTQVPATFAAKVSTGK